MNFCSQCGSDQLAFSIPQGDTSPRYWCQQCATIHYQNPRNVVGTLPVWEGKILLCRRAIAPRYGTWTLPAGYMENGETLQEGAIRETWEEACATVQLSDLYTVFNIAHIYQVHVFFLAEMVNENFAAGEESLEVELFHPKDIPWDEISFPSVKRTLKFYLKDRQRNYFPTRVRDLSPMR
ncbi:MAG TPA: NUDIX hydrolase [Alcanivoracaceae bacterium]|nr:NUDIX hydrolase [Alcanivoracaceae bacterium]